MYWINVYDTPNGPHYSRPYSTLDTAISARQQFEFYTAHLAKTLHPHTYAGSLRVKLKDPALARHLQGGPTLFSGCARRRQAPEPIPEGYVNATELCKPTNREFRKYWETRAARRHADKVAAQLGRDRAGLIWVMRGGNAKQQGTWIHPRLAEHLRAWLGLDVKDAA